MESRKTSADTSRNIAIRFVCFALFCLFLVASGFALNFFFFLYKPSSRCFEIRQVNIIPGMNLTQISSRLEEKGVISSAFKFKLLVLLEGKQEELKAGEYRFSTLLAPQEVLRKLLEGQVKLQRITLPEGLTYKQVAKMMAAHGLGSYESIVEILKDSNFIKKLGLSAPNLEGYLFPDTYYYSKRERAKDLIIQMVGQFKKHFSKIWETRSHENPLTKKQVVILASMVEKEAMVDSERPIIAGVFLNRLKKGMLLQCDPTVIYGLSTFDGNIRRKDLKTNTPYNTYINKGLPPGPICNPGCKSLEAAARPANVPYLYFVSMNNGHHFFSRTISEHIKAVRHYQLKKSKAP